MRWVLGAGALLAPIAAAIFAHLSGASQIVTVFAALAAGVAVYLAARQRTTDENAADLGRGLLVTILVTTGIAYVEHQGQEREKRQALALTLSSGQVLRGVDLHDRNLEGFYLASKDLSGANLSGTRLHAAILRYTTLAGADLHGSETDLSGADMHFIHANAVNLDGANVRGADLSEATMRGANLVNADLRDANLQGAKLSRADLRGADLRGAVLAGADLSDALLDADLRRAVFSVDYRNATLENVALAHARYDGTTRWPPDFDPRAHAQKLAHDVAHPPVPAGAGQDVVEEVANADALLLRERGPVRLIGFVAPQKVLKPFDCYAAASFAEVKRLMQVGTRVRYVLGADPEDNFKRALAYVWLPDGRFLNQLMVERGDAEPLESPPNTRYARQIAAAYVRAEMARRGLWGACPAGSLSRR